MKYKIQYQIQYGILVQICMDIPIYKVTVLVTEGTLVPMV